MKPLAYVDTETTGTSVTSDAIWSLGLYSPDVDFQQEWIMKPWKPLPPEVEQLCNVTNAYLEQFPPFKEFASKIYSHLQEFDLAGFNVRGFDVPIIFEELFRCGLTWDTSMTLIIDHGVIFKKREERTLGAGVKFYTGQEHTGAHGALADCVGTRLVAMGQMIKYPELARMKRAELAAESEYEGPTKLTYDGKIVLIDGVPHYAFGKYFDKPGPIKDDPGLGQWMLSKDFPEQTKMVMRRILNDIEQQELAAFEQKRAAGKQKATQKGLL